MEPGRTRLLEFATQAITFLKERGLLEEFLQEKYLELRPRDKAWPIK